MSPRFLTFDCYGTLVDWETGILGTVGRVFRAHGVDVPEVDVVVRYAELEARFEGEGEWRPYREVLIRVMRELCREHGISPSEEEARALAVDLPDWPLFGDTVESLRRLNETWGLAVVSNVDDDLFAGTRRRLGVDFDEVVTAEQARAYKPALRPFELLVDRLGCPRSEILHVAQSLYHDLEPARRLGLPSIRVDRPSRVRGRGLAPPVAVEPEVEVPDLASVVERLGA